MLPDFKPQKRGLGRGRGLRGATVRERLYSQVHKLPGEDACWIWTGQLNSTGYGQIKVGGRNGQLKLAHRVSLSLEEELIPGLVVMHACDNRQCVRPSHLSQGTQSENGHQMSERRRSKAMWFSDDVALQIRAAAEAGLTSQKAIAEQFGVSQSTVHRLLRRKCRRHLP